MTSRMPDEIELLSAYLDNALPARQREALEARLADSAELRAQLDDLRAVRAMLRSTPVLQPPRDFRLDPSKHARVTWWSRLGALRLTGAVSAAAALLLIALGLLLGNAPSAPAQPVALQATDPSASTPVSLQAVDVPTLTPTVVAPAVAPPLMAPFAVTAPPEIGLLMATEDAPSDMAEMVSRTLPTAAAAAEPTPQADLSVLSAEMTLPPLARLAIIVGAVLLIVSSVLFLIATFQRRP